MKLSSFNFENYTSDFFWQKHSPQKVFCVMTLNAEGFYLIKTQKGWGKIIKNVDYFVCDGVGLAKGYQFLTGKKPVKCSGVDLVDSLIIKAPQTPTYIWGSTEENIQKAAKAYKKRGLNLVGFHNGFTGKDEEVLEKIKKSGAKIVFVGMRAKRQMELAVLINKKLGITSMNVGGSFDVAGGVFMRAPIFIQKIGFEWLWRMMLDPKRFKRLPLIFGFLWLVLLEKLGRKE